MTEQTTVGRLWSVTLDCADPEQLANFWIGMLGGTVEFSSPEFVGVQLATGLWIGAYRVPDHTPATWPGGDTVKQFHLDVAVEDMDVAEQAALRLGAIKADHQPQPDSWRVFFDPAGHPFCLTDHASL